jgi:hypothetical protein
MVDQLPPHPKVKGSSETAAAGSGKERMPSKNYLTVERCSGSSQAAPQTR